MARDIIFFGMIAQLEDRKKFQMRLSEFSEEDEVRALSSQIFLVSKNVLRKHKWVNRGFLFIALTLVFFLASGVSYVARINLVKEPNVKKDRMDNERSLKSFSQTPNNRFESDTRNVRSAQTERWAIYSEGTL